MAKEFSLPELAEAVQAWCDEHEISPANGQAAESLTERTIRYYRTLGLLDPPLGHYTRSFTEKHRLQLIAIRAYQAQGVPLRKIREELYGQSQEDLVEIEKQIARKGKAAVTFAVPFGPPVSAEGWAVMPLTDNFLLISRDGGSLPAAVLAKINEVLSQALPSTRQVTQN
jgi:DNA-binding transcriptional MerR regulator